MATPFDPEDSAANAAAMRAFEVTIPNKGPSWPWTPEDWNQLDPLSIKGYISWWWMDKFQDAQSGIVTYYLAHTPTGISGMGADLAALVAQLRHQLERASVVFDKEPS